MHSINALLSGFWKTRGHIQSAMLNANGWDIRHHDPKVTAEPQVFLYVADLPTNFIWMCSISREAFVEASTKASQMKGEAADKIRGALLFVLFGAASGEPVAQLDGYDWEMQLGILMATYAGTTRTWDLAGRMSGGGHFIVLNYRDTAEEKESNLRPFALVKGNNNLPLSSDKLHEILVEVVKTDINNHPEWFGMSSVNPPSR